MGKGLYIINVRLYMRVSPIQIEAPKLLSPKQNKIHIHYGPKMTKHQRQQLMKIEVKS